MNQFYLYRIFYDDMTLYIGKGSGKRLWEQKRAFGVDGEIIAYFSSEECAYREERRLIAQQEPPLNRHPGGCGGWVTSGDTVLPNGLTDEGLPVAAPHLARVLFLWKRDPDLVGLLSIIGAYVSAHGFDKVAAALGPHIKRLPFNDLALENSR